MATIKRSQNGSAKRPSPGISPAVSQQVTRTITTDNMTVSIGDRVVIHGLVSASNLNGQHGVVVDELDLQTGRYSVSMNEDDSVIRVKPVNISLEKDNHNDDDDDDEVIVLSSSSSHPSSSIPKNHHHQQQDELAIGTEVVIRNLVNSAHLNGLHGIVKSNIDQSTGRYSIDVMDNSNVESSIINIKSMNLTPVLMTSAAEYIDDGNDGKLYAHEEEENEELRIGTEVVVRNLVNSAHLNGLHGIVKSNLNQSTGRYSIEVIDNSNVEPSIINIKSMNLSPVLMTSAAEYTDDDNDDKSYADDEKYTPGGVVGTTVTDMNGDEEKGMTVDDDYDENNNSNSNQDADGDDAVNDRNYGNNKSHCQRYKYYYIGMVVAVVGVAVTGILSPKDYREGRGCTGGNDATCIESDGVCSECFCVEKDGDRDSFCKDRSKTASIFAVVVMCLFAVGFFVSLVLCAREGAGGKFTKTQWCGIVSAALTIITPIIVFTLS